MSIAYTRAVVDRDATGDAGPIRFVAATEGRKADGIDLRMTGARLDRFRANPVVLYGHRYFSRDDLPIGRAVGVEVDGPRLLIDAEFDQGDDFAMTVERKYRSGFLNAVSIGFDVTKWQSPNDNVWSGGVADEWELLELSAVPVPMDAGAVVQSGRAATSDTERALLRALVAEFGLDQVLTALRSTLTSTPAADGESESNEPTDPPAPAGVNPDAARTLLAALTPEGTSHE